MNIHTVMLALFAVAAGAILGVAGLRWWQGLQADAKGIQAMLGGEDHAPRPAPPMPPTPPAARPEPDAADPNAAWQALPGGHLELRATGFYIQAYISPTAHPYYALTSPEGKELGWTVHLAALKDLGEKLAAEREEFQQMPAQAIAMRTIAAAKRTDGAT